MNENILVEDIAFEWASVFTEKRTFEEKFNEYTRKVYGCNYSLKPKFTVKLKEEIDHSDKRNERRSKKRTRLCKIDMNEDVDNLILIAVEYFRLPPYMADRVKLIMARMWSHPDNFHDLKYENVVLGILMYVVYENFSEDATVDFKGYCTLLFGEARTEKNIKQIYRAYGIVFELYEEVEREYEAYEFERRKRKCRRMKKYNKA